VLPDSRKDFSRCSLVWCQCKNLLRVSFALDCKDAFLASQLPNHIGAGTLRSQCKVERLGERKRLQAPATSILASQVLSMSSEGKEHTITSLPGLAVERIPCLSVRSRSISIQSLIDRGSRMRIAAASWSTVDLPKVANHNIPDCPPHADQLCVDTSRTNLWQDCRR
jgi:hypothetical protein